MAASSVCKLLIKSIFDPGVLFEWYPERCNKSRKRLHKAWEILNSITLWSCTPVDSCWTSGLNLPWNCLQWWRQWCRSPSLQWQCKDYCTFQYFPFRAVVTVLLHNIESLQVSSMECVTKPTSVASTFFSIINLAQFDLTERSGRSWNITVFEVRDHMITFLWASNRRK